MAFKVVPGTFHVVGYSPDGDSIRFKADDPCLWEGLEGPAVDVNKKGHAQLRFEAIDTLETHYSGPHHQPEAYAVGARDRLFELLGIGSVVWNEKGTEVLSASDGTPGYVVAKVVEKNRRPVSFVFAGPPARDIAGDLFLTAAHLKDSVNFALIREGLAYPTFYSGLFFDLRKAFSKAVRSARFRKAGIWKEDATTTGFAFPSIQDLENELVILPKLFRRFIEFLKQGSGQGGQGFLDFLEAKQDRLMVVDTRHFTHLDDIIEFKKGRIKLTELPENLIFME